MARGDGKPFVLPEGTDAKGPPRASVRPYGVVYDDVALYVAVDCEQVHSPIIARLTRRDREVEADWVSIALDTRRDGKSAFVFEANAGGALLDVESATTDTDYLPDFLGRAELWDARVAIREAGLVGGIPHSLSHPAVSVAPDPVLGVRGAPLHFDQARDGRVGPRIAQYWWRSVALRCKLDGLVGLAAASAPSSSEPFVSWSGIRQDATSLTRCRRSATLTPHEHAPGRDGLHAFGRGSDSSSGTPRRT